MPEFELLHQGNCHVAYTLLRNEVKVLLDGNLEMSKTLTKQKGRGKDH